MYFYTIVFDIETTKINFHDNILTFKKIQKRKVGIYISNSLEKPILYINLIHGEYQIKT